MPARAPQIIVSARVVNVCITYMVTKSEYCSGLQRLTKNNRVVVSAAVVGFDEVDEIQM